MMEEIRKRWVKKGRVLEYSILLTIYNLLKRRFSYLNSYVYCQFLRIGEGPDLILELRDLNILIEAKNWHKYNRLSIKKAEKFILDRFKHFEEGSKKNIKILVISHIGKKAREFLEKNNILVIELREEVLRAKTILEVREKIKEILINEYIHIDKPFRRRLENLNIWLNGVDRAAALEPPAQYSMYMELWGVIEWIKNILENNTIYNIVKI